MEPPPGPFASARTRTVCADEEFALASSDDAAMMISLRLAGAAALCAALLLSACAKKTDQTTTASTDATTATTAPAADGAASAAPDASATTAPELAASTAPGEASTMAPSTTASSTTATTSGAANGSGSGAYITLPVYPGAVDAKDNGSMSISTNTGSIAMKSYTTTDDAKEVADWYKAHLPSAFTNAILTSDNKTNATFVDEHKDGDQSVLVTTQDAGTRIQLTTKHGK
jgi:hypothetical protein